MEQKHNFEELREVDPNYPKVKFRLAKKGEIELVSPAYPRIAINENNIAEKKYDKHPYITMQVQTAEEEAKLGKEWVNHPSLLS